MGADMASAETLAYLSVEILIDWWYEPLQAHVVNDNFTRFYAKLFSLKILSQ